jgi:pimeloyl-ACP methyl ester carboxylesterase
MRFPCSAAVCATLFALLTAGCGKHDEPIAAKQPPPPAPANGSPRIVSSADGVHIQYRVYGAGEPAVILIHCWSCDSNYWSAQVPALKSRYTTVTMDLAGHGASGRNRTDWSMAHYGEDVAAVAQELPNPKIILVGHSMGGPVVLEAAQRLGARVIGIIAVDTLKTIGQPPVSAQEIQMRLKPFRENFIGYAREFVSGSFFTKDANPQFVRKIADDMSLAPPEVAIPSLEAVMKMDFAPLVAQLRVPVVAINADATGATDDARIQKSLPAFRSVTIPNTGHFLMMEAPERFNPILLHEIDAIEKNAGS